jgi:hypothetical protein
MSANLNFETNMVIDDYWQDEWGNLVHDFIKKINVGEDLPPHFFPKSAYTRTAGTFVSPMFSRQYWICTDAVQQAIEQLEPGVHAFYPLAIREEENGDVVAHRFVINIRQRIDAVNLEQSENVRIKKFKSGSGQRVSFQYTELAKGKQTIALEKPLVDGKHLWVGIGAFGPGDAFVSDELKEAILSVEPDAAKSVGFFAAGYAEENPKN